MMRKSNSIIFEQDKKAFLKFLAKLAKSCELIAPVKKDIIKYKKITDVNDICLEGNSHLPVKEYFFKKEEVLFQFNKTKFTAPKLNMPPRVFFGLRKCDLNAIKRQDMMFNLVQDPYYKAAREKSYLLGYHCNSPPSQYCFCGSLNLVDFFDLMFYDKKDYFLVEVGSDKGMTLVKKFRKFFILSDKMLADKDKKIIGADRLERKDISQLYDHPDWKKVVELCLSCAACTILCPTCYCFEICDKTTENSKGERKRQWSSCQLQEFTRVAGNYIFRENREERFKHRIYHQLDYFKQKHGINLCVGCGRCIEGCPTKIDFIEIINNMK